MSTITEKEVQVLRGKIKVLDQTVELFEAKLDKALQQIDKLQQGIVQQKEEPAITDTFAFNIVHAMKRVPEKEREILPFEPTVAEITEEEFVEVAEAKYEQMALEEIGAPACKVEGCTSEILSKGFCSTHYHRNHRYGDPLFDPKAQSKKSQRRSMKAAKAKRKKRKSLCTYGDCKAQVHAKDLCSHHYYRAKEYGDPGYTKEKVAN